MHDPTPWRDAPQPRSFVFATLIAVAALLVPLIPASAETIEPPRLAVNQDTFSLDFPEPTPLRTIYQAIATAGDFQVVFDSRLKDSKLRLSLQDVTVAQALDAVGKSAETFWAATGTNTFVVADDTPRARAQYEHQMIFSWRPRHLEIKDAMTTLRSLLGVKHIAADVEQGTLTLRDSAEQVAIARELLERIDRPLDEVSVLVELVRLEGSTFEELTTSGPKIDRQALNPYLAKEDRHLLRTTAGLLGRRPARFETHRRAGTDRSLGLEVQLSGRVDPATRDIALRLETGLVLTSPGGGEQPAQVHGSQETSSNWRLADGSSLLIEVPSHLSTPGETVPFGSTAEGEVLALVLTPKIERVGEAEPAEAFWVGSETRAVAP